MATVDPIFLSLAGLDLLGVSGAGEPFLPVPPGVPIWPEAVDTTLPRRPGTRHRAISCDTLVQDLLDIYNNANAMSVYVYSTTLGYYSF